MLDIDLTDNKRKKDALGIILSDLESATSLVPERLVGLRKDLEALIGGNDIRTTSDELLKAETIIAFTFRPTVDDCLELWFGKSASTDSDIWRKFAKDVYRATNGEFDHWALAADRPRMLLALIILLDQFRRNMFRDKPEMYAADPRCLELTKRAIRHGVVTKLSPIERVFPCLVLTHSEAIQDQYLCKEEWAKVESELVPTDPLRVFHEVFDRHVSVIQEFGRFPHRNALLGRESTPEELRFLNNADFRFDLPLVKGKDGSFSFQGAIEGRKVEEVAGDAAGLSFNGTDQALAQAELDVRERGFAEVDALTLRKFIIERDTPPVGTDHYRKLKL